MKPAPLRKKGRPSRSSLASRPASALRAAIAAGDLGAYLRLARERAGYSQADVAARLGMSHFQSVSQWERNASGSVPIPSLRKLVEIYDLPMQEVYEVLLKFQTARLENKLEQRFFAKQAGSRRRGAS
jgi:transcriptional regulator with XRE-family HTH domain